MRSTQAGGYHRPRSGRRSGRLGHGRRRAAAIVEAALVMPIMIAVLMGIIEFSAIFFVRHNMYQAAREGARTAAIKDGTVAEATQAAQNLLSNMPGINYVITVTIGGPGLDVTVTVAAPLSEVSLGDPLGIWAPTDNLQVEVVMRREG